MNCEQLARHAVEYQMGLLLVTIIFLAISFLLGYHIYKENAK